MYSFWSLGLCRKSCIPAPKVKAADKVSDWASAAFLRVTFGMNKLMNIGLFNVNFVINILILCDLR